MSLNFALLYHANHAVAAGRAAVARLEGDMTIELNHTIVPSRDKAESARFYVRIFGFAYDGPLGHFEPVKIAAQALTLDFDDGDDFDAHHYAFKVSEAEFDEIFARVKAEGLAYGGEPRTPEDGEINHWGGGRGVYFRDPSGHLLELLTKDYTPELFADG